MTSPDRPAAPSTGIGERADKAFEVLERGYRIVGTYLANPHASWAIVEAFKGELLVRTLRCEAYRVYNYEAHASDLIDAIEDANRPAAPSDAEVEALIRGFEAAVRDKTILATHGAHGIDAAAALVIDRRAALRSLLAERRGGAEAITTHMHRMLALVGMALDGHHVSREFGGSAPEDVQGLLDKAFTMHAARARTSAPVSERTFPLQADAKPAQPGPLRIPWAIAEEAYSAYVQSFGKSQTLERLAERGGFGWTEMDGLLPGWRERCARASALETFALRTLEILSNRDRHIEPALRAKLEVVLRDPLMHCLTAGDAGLILAVARSLSLLPPAPKEGKP